MQRGAGESCGARSKAAARAAFLSLRGVLRLGLALRVGCGCRCLFAMQRGRFRGLFAWRCAGYFATRSTSQARGFFTAQGV
jgi:hypothetical protein